MISRALILDGDKILLIHRFNKGREYFVIPGGHIENGETEEEALVREIKEETNLDVIQIDKKLWSLRNSFDNEYHHFFLVTKFSGNIQFGGPELETASEENKYILEWHNLNELEGLKVVPEPVKEKINNHFSIRKS